MHSYGLSYIGPLHGSMYVHVYVHTTEVYMHAYSVPVQSGGEHIAPLR